MTKEEGLEYLQMVLKKRNRINEYKQDLAYYKKKYSVHGYMTTDNEVFFIDLIRYYESEIQKEERELNEWCREIGTYPSEETSIKRLSINA